jgi:hypothetical protein
MTRQSATARNSNLIGYCRKSDLFLEIRNILTEKRLTESEKVQKE